MVAPLLLAAAPGIASGLLGGLSDWLGGKSAREQAQEQRGWQEETLAQQYQKALEKEQREQAYLTARRGAAGQALGGYGYAQYGQAYTPFSLQAYQSPLQGGQYGQQALLSQYLTGQLTPAQEMALGRQRELGYGAIEQRAVGGMPTGARAGLYGQLERDIGLGAAQMAQQQQQFGLQQAIPYEQMWEQRFLQPQQVAREEKRYGYEQGLAEWMRGQQARQRLQELQSQIALTG